MKRFIITKNDEGYKVVETNKDYQYGYESRELAMAAKEVAEQADAYQIELEAKYSILSDRPLNPAGLNLTNERKKNNERVKKSYRLKKDK